MPYRPPLYGIFWGHIFCKYGGWGWSELFSVSGRVKESSPIVGLVGGELLKREWSLAPPTKDINTYFAIQNHLFAAATI